MSKQYIQYHKVWKHGNPLLFPRPKAFTSDIPQKQGHAFSAIEERSRVWLIYRDSEESKEYYLAYTFTAVDFELEGEKIILFSEPGKAEVFMPPIALNRKKDSWFAELMSRHGNFGLGFMPLNEDGVCNLEAILASSSTVPR